MRLRENFITLYLHNCTQTYTFALPPQFGPQIHIHGAIRKKKSRINKSQRKHSRAQMRCIDPVKKGFDKEKTGKSDEVVGQLEQPKSVT